MSDDKKALLSVRDENTILITASFYIEDPLKNKVGDSRDVHYDIELIVKNDITCDKLLDAIKDGLSAKIEGYDNLAGDVDMDSDESDRINEHTIYKTCFDVFMKCYESYCNSYNIQEYERSLSIVDDTIGYSKVANVEGEKLIEIKSMPRIIVECVDYKKYKSKIPQEDSSAYSIADAAQLWLSKKEHGNKRLSESKFRDDNEIEKGDLGFLTSTRILFTLYDAGVKTDDREQHILLFRTSDIREGYRKTVPLYNISNRPLYKLNNEPIKIIPPTEPPEKSKTNVLRLLLAPVMMNIGMIFVMLLGGTYGNGFTVFVRYAIMVCITLSMTIWGLIDQNKSFDDSVKQWKNRYEEYIKRILLEIDNKQEKDIEQLKKIYPSMLELDRNKTQYSNAPSFLEGKFGILKSKKMSHIVNGESEEEKHNSNEKHYKSDEQTLVKMCEEVHPDIFSRGPEHPDFMSVRLGVSGRKSQLAPSVFPIVGEKKDYVFTAVKYTNIDSKKQDVEPFRIIMPKELENTDENKDYLITLPEKLAQEYGYLKNAPVLLKLKECGTLGLVFPKSISFLPFLDNLILNLSFYHSPDDLQMVFFCSDKEGQSVDMEYLTGGSSVPNEWLYKQSIIEKYKHLPHFRELLGDLSAFAFTQKDANLVFNRLLEILSERKENKGYEKYPHILLIFKDEYDFKRHPVSEYLSEYTTSAEKKDYGISFVFCKRHEEELPKYCGQVIVGEQKTKDATDYLNNNIRWYLMPHEQKIVRKEDGLVISDEDGRNNKQLYEFVADNWDLAINNIDLKAERHATIRAYKVLSALYYYRIAQGAGVPEFVSLFDLFINPKTNLREDFLKYVATEEKIRLDQDIKAYITKQWEMSRDITKSLAVPIGKRAGGEVVMLDLHEKADGPHMLVAGTTGSGKTETLLTYLTELCLMYTPEQVNLLLMDMKGAGFVKRIGHLPHVVGSVTDVEGDETGTSMVYMLKRFLNSMSAEIKRRKLLLSKMDVDSVDKYIEAKNNLDKHIANKKHLEKERKELEELPQLAHLFMVVDEFTELMRFTSDNSDVDFKTEITSLARIGRSLGFHIILISQNIENAITPDIRVNSRARLCLKVATKEASREMIGTDLAASPMMPGNGRAYLLVGTGSRFEYFQSGYSGAGIIESPDRPYKITQAEMSGHYSLFFDSEKKKDIRQKEQIEMITQIEEISDQIVQCFEGSKMIRPRKVFQSPLPKGCYYEFDWKSKKGHYKRIDIDESDKKGQRGVL